jgi:hypothetical protein
MRTIILALFLLGLVACGGNETTNIRADLNAMSESARVEYHLQNDEYDQAFDFVRDRVTEEPLRTELLIATHATFAWELTHGTVSDQRTRMPAALRHLRRIMELDPHNAMALEQIELIEGIYRSMNREVPSGVAEDRAALELN